MNKNHMQLGDVYKQIADIYRDHEHNQSKLSSIQWWNSTITKPAAHTYSSATNAYKKQKPNRLSGTSKKGSTAIEMVTKVSPIMISPIWSTSSLSVIIRKDNISLQELSRKKVLILSASKLIFI